MHFLHHPGNVLGIRNTVIKRVVMVIVLNEYLFVCVHVCICVCIYLAYEHYYEVAIWSYVIITINNINGALH